MFRYILRRLVGATITLAIVLSIVFVLLRQMPIEGYFENFDKLDPAVIHSRLAQMGLTDPVVVQLKNFFANMLKGDLGLSARYRVGAPIGGIIAQKAPLSAILGLLSIAVAMICGIPLGAAMARSKGHFWDKFGTLFIVVINAVPAAVYYILIQMYATDILKIPMLFARDNPVTWILPVFSMSLGNTAYYAMWLRRYMLDEMNRDYVKLAAAKGVSRKRITMRHVFRNAFVPMIQYLPASILYTVGGSIYIESLYSIPGMGGLLVTVISRQDNPMVQAIVILYCAIGVVSLLLGDLLMGLVDPRIKFAKKEDAR